MVSFSVVLVIEHPFMRVLRVLEHPLLKYSGLTIMVNQSHQTLVGLDDSF